MARQRVVAVLAVTILSVFALASAAPAASYFIDFETLPGGGTPTVSAPVMGSYSAWGVGFSGGGLATQPTFVPGTTPSTGGTPPGSMYAGTRSRNVQQGAEFDLIATFTTPVMALSANVITALNRTATMTAYDAGGTAIGTVTYAASATDYLLGSQTLTSATPIASVRWVSSAPIQSVTGIDNLWYRPTPEPGTLLLFGLGAIGVVVAARRRRRSA
jgi:PEP-CTERM motif